jgi:uncharacterized protein (TIGR03437 family)
MALRRGGMVLLLLASPVCGQFSQLAATDDGSQLYFTSQMLLKGAASSSPSPESRLYRFGPNGVTLFAERGSLAPPNSFSSGDGVVSPRVSSDGSLVGFTFDGVCSAIPGCAAITNEAELRGSQTLDLGPGNMQLSRSGRWALVTNVVFDPSYPSLIGAGSARTLVDLTTGQRTSVPLTPYGLSSLGSPSSFTLASDGTALVVTSAPATGTGNTITAGFGLWKQGQLTRIQFPQGLMLMPIALSDDASTVICYGYPSGSGTLPSQIVALDLASGKATLVFQSKDSTQMPVFMAASNNGQRVLYRIGSLSTLSGLAYVWDSPSSATMPVPLADGELANDGTLSGLGGFAFLATTRSRIVKFSAQSRTVSPLFPATPYCDDPGAVGGGSMVRLHCSFTASSASLQGQILYDGQPLPVLFSNPGDIGIQIPWQWNNSLSPTLSLNLPSDSPFQASQPLNVFDGAPALIPDDPGESSLFGIKIVKGDWSGLLTSQPGPGDIVYIYMTGLGWPQTPEVTGVAASLTKVNPIQWKLGCQFLPQAAPAQLLFAGLAPGMTGIYQTAFRMPSDAGAAPLSGLSCTLASPVMTVTFGPGTSAIGMYGSGSVVAGSISSKPFGSYSQPGNEKTSTQGQ